MKSFLIVFFTVVTIYEEFRQYFCKNCVTNVFKIDLDRIFLCTISKFLENSGGTYLLNAAIILTKLLLSNIFKIHLINIRPYAYRTFGSWRWQSQNHSNLDVTLIWHTKKICREILRKQQKNITKTSIWFWSMLQSITQNSHTKKWYYVCT